MAHSHASSVPLPPTTAAGPRRCAPEILDALPATHPDALASRRDLRHLNRLMGNFAWIERTVSRCARRHEGVLELGAGDGELARRLQRAGIAAAALDRAPRPTDWPAAHPWHQVDLLEFSGWAGTPVVFANLFLHHFDSAALRALGAQLDQHARVIIASEPARRRSSHLLLRLACAVIRAHDVTRHDGAVSIDAGFRGDELPSALGLPPARWEWRTRTTLFGAYRLIAIRRS